MFREDYATLVDPTIKVHGDQIAACARMLQRVEEIKQGKIKPRPRLHDYGNLWSLSYDPTAEDVRDIKIARAEGRAVPHQIVDLVIAKAARLENPSTFLGHDFPRQFGRNHFYTPERYNDNIHPVEISMLLNSGSGHDVLTSVWLERSAQAPAPGWLGKIHLMAAEKPNEYATNLAMRLLKKPPELVGPPREVFNRYDEFHQAAQGSYRALMTEMGHDRALEMMADANQARKKSDAERGARESAEIARGGLYNGIKRWVRDSLAIQCGPGGY